MHTVRRTDIDANQRLCIKICYCGVKTIGTERETRKSIAKIGRDDATARGENMLKTVASFLPCHKLNNRPFSKGNS